MSFTLKRQLYESAPAPLRGLVRVLPFAWLAGPAYRRTFARKRFFETAGREEVLAWQEGALGEMLDFATREVPAYRAHRRAVERHRPFEALRDFPTLSKEDVQKRLHDHLPESIESIPHYEITTGGTTGNQLSLFVDDESQAVELAFLHRIWEWVDYRPRARKATFRGVPFPDLPEGVYWQENPVYNELQFSPFHLSEETVERYLDALIAFRPTYLHGYPSAISVVAAYVLRSGRSADLPPIRAALLHSEGFIPAQRDAIERAFRAESFPVYGQSERVILGAECGEARVYHHVPDYGILEICDEGGKAVSEDGGRGELVGTGLRNRSMPLIRYRTGDVATRLPAACACGLSWDRFTDVEPHRGQEALIGRHGGRVTLAALNMHGDVFERVARFQYVQTEPGAFIVRVVPGRGFTDSDVDTLLEAYREKVGDELAVSVELVDEIPLTARGKYRWIVREEAT